MTELEEATSHFAYVKVGKPLIDILCADWSRPVQLMLLRPAEVNGDGVNELQWVARHVDQSELEEARAEIQKLKDADQRWVDQVVHYRNLAINLGADPSDMLNFWDKELCTRGFPRNPGDDSYSLDDQRADNLTFVDEVEIKDAEIARFRGLLSDLADEIAGEQELGSQCCFGEQPPVALDITQGLWRWQWYCEEHLPECPSAVRFR